MYVSYDQTLSPMPHEPGVLLVHLLNQCNLHCQHCYLNSSPSRNIHLPLNLVIRSLGEVEQLGIKTVYLSGGEPLLYPGLAKVLDFMSQQLKLELCISTNGTLIGKKEAKLLKESGVNAQVSIDGPEAYHDRFRGFNGAFRSANRGIQNLISNEVPVTLVTTICKDNLEYLQWLAEWAAGISVERISVQPLLRLGRGYNIKEKKLSKEQLCQLFLQLSDLGYAYHSRGLRFSLVYRSRAFLREHPCAAYVCNGTHCHRKVEKEIKKLVIREDGSVLPEIPTLNPQFALGNLLEGTLTELISSYFACGYSKFDQLCRTVYEELIPTWKSPIIPWDEIISERSWAFDI